MKRIKKHKKLILILLFIALSIGLQIYARKVTDDYIQRSVDKAYVDGYTKGVQSVKLEDVCFEPEKKGMGTDFTRGFGYDVVQCKVNLHDWKEDWEFEGNWDRCDSNGENCEPFVEDGLYLEPGQSISL